MILTKVIMKESDEENNQVGNSKIKQLKVN